MTTEERVIKIEQQLRFYRVLLVALVALGISGIAAAVNWRPTNNIDPALIRAQRFVLVDGNGNERAEWKLNDNEPILVLNGSGKNLPAVVNFGIDSKTKTAFLRFSGSGHQTSASIEVSPQFSHASVFSSGDPGSTISLRTDVNQSPSLDLNSGHQGRVSLTAEKSRSAVIVRDPNLLEKKFEIKW